MLSSADRVVAPTTGNGTLGRAEAVVRHALPDLALTRLPFDMSASGASADQARAESQRSAAQRLVPWLQDGEHVAFATLGDPNIYSTFSSLVTVVRELGCDAAVDTVPGITAFQDLAARSGTVLLDGTEALSLVTALDGTARFAEALEDDERAVVVYKGGKYLPEMAREAAARNRLAGSVMGELLGLPGEHVVPLAERQRGEASYLATVIVPPVARGAGSSDPPAGRGTDR